MRKADTTDWWWCMMKQGHGRCNARAKEGRRGLCGEGDEPTGYKYEEKKGVLTSKALLLLLLLVVGTHSACRCGRAWVASTPLAKCGDDEVKRRHPPFVALVRGGMRCTQAPANQKRVILCNKACTTTRQSTLLLPDGSRRRLCQHLPCVWRFSAPEEKSTSTLYTLMRNSPAA